MQHDRFVLAMASLFISSAICWSLLAAAVTNHFARGAVALEAPGAAVTAIVGALFSLSRALRKRDDGERRRMREEYERREAALIKTAAYAALARTTGPIPTPPYAVPRPYVVR